MKAAVYTEDSPRGNSLIERLRERGIEVVSVLYTAPGTVTPKPAGAEAVIAFFHYFGQDVKKIRAAGDRWGVPVYTLETNVGTWEKVLHIKLEKQEAHSMKAVVFSRFPENLSAQLREHLEKDYGIEIVYFGPPNIELQKTECDVIITFFELMSHAHADIGAKLGRRWGVRHVLLQRKVSTWVHQLPKIVGKVQVAAAKVAVNDTVPMPAPQLSVVREVAPLPPPEEPEERETLPAEAPVVGNVGTERDALWNEISAMFETEIADLKKKLTGAGQELAHLEARRVEENKKVNEQLRAESKLRFEAENRAKALEQSCNIITENRKKLERDIEKLENENEELDKALQTVKAELEDEKSKKSGGLGAAFVAVQTLYEAGAMDEEAAGKMLANLLLKKK